MRLGGDAIAAVQAEQVARFQYQRADLIVAAAIALQLIEQNAFAAATQMQVSCSRRPSTPDWAASR